MKEHFIEVEILEDGTIKAETNGIKGPTCIKEIEILFKDIAEIYKIDKTDEYYEKDVKIQNRTSKRIKS